MAGTSTCECCCGVGARGCGGETGCAAEAGCAGAGSGAGGCADAGVAGLPSRRASRRGRTGSRSGGSVGVKLGAARSRCGRLGWIELRSPPRGEARRGWGARLAPSAIESLGRGLTTSPHWPRGRSIDRGRRGRRRRPYRRFGFGDVSGGGRGRRHCGEAGCRPRARDGRGTARGEGAPVARRGEPQLGPLRRRRAGVGDAGWGTPRRRTPLSAPAGPGGSAGSALGRRLGAPRRRGRARGWVRRQAVGERGRGRRARVAAPGPAQA